MAEADRHLQGWFKAFPGTSSNPVRLALGNHDRLPDRKRKFIGLPKRCFQPFRKIWDLPDTWIDAYTHEIDGVIYMHGTGLSGDSAHTKAAAQNRQSTVIGHTHHTGSVTYLVSERDRIFGMNVGSGIDRNLLAFEYGRDFLKKPFIGCGVVTDRGKLAQVFPMAI